MTERNAHSSNAKSATMSFNFISAFVNPLNTSAPIAQKPFLNGKNGKMSPSINVITTTIPIAKKNFRALNRNEKKLRRERLSQFKINYQYREYHYIIDKLKLTESHKPTINLIRIHQNRNILALILTLHISYDITVRKTAHMLRKIWNINVSDQTVLNYAQSLPIIVINLI